MHLYNRTGLSDQVQYLKNATVVPPREKGGALGVMDADGTFCEFSRDFVRPRKLTPAPTQEEFGEPQEHYEGAYLYGGWMHPHFGHFLTETTARLWALEGLRNQIKGIVFVPLGPGSIWRARKSHLPFLDLLTGGVDIIPLTRVASFETLYVPDPGFGHQNRMRSSACYKSFTREAFSRSVEPEGPKKLYISRTQLPDHKGGVFGEDRIEKMLSAEGYDIFHPQKHDAETQLARYMAADQIVGLDGSAFHMVAYAARSSAKIGVIYRRRGELLSRLSAQVRGFTGADVHDIDVIKDIWVNKDKVRVDYSAIGELDFDLLGKTLKQLGFTQKTSKVRSLSNAAVKKIQVASGRENMVRLGQSDKENGFDLRQITTSVVSRPSDTERREHLREKLSQLKLNWVFADRQENLSPQQSVAVAHAEVFDGASDLPFLICDGDAELVTDNMVLPPLPEDADIVYLATNQAGCLPGTGPNNTTFSPVALPGCALAEAHDDVFLKLYAMTSVTAVLVVSERGKKRFREELTKSIRRKTDAGVRYSFAMPDLNVYAFRQSRFMNVNPATSSDVEAETPKKDMTPAKLEPVEEGTRRVTESWRWRLNVEACRNANGGLEWQVVDGELKQFQIAERVEYVASYNRVRVPHSRYMGTRRARQISRGHYERPELDAAKAILKPNDRLVEMGSGLGVVGAIAISDSPGTELLSFEANPDLIQHIEALYRLNGFDNRANIRNSVVISDDNRPETIKFHLHGSFLGSSLFHTGNRHQPTVQIPTTAWDDICKDYKPNVLMADIEGGELDFLEHADLSGLTGLIMEFHPRVYGKEGMERCKQLIRDKGFTPLEEVCTPTVWGAIRKEVQD